MNQTPAGPPRATDRALAVVSFLFVAFLYFHMSAAKFATVQRLPAFDPKDDTGLFWTENAFHYRYAKMAAAGLDLPDVDPKMQYPEGMHVLRDETPMMERFAGFCYRHLPHRAAPFHVYLLWLACFYSSATIFPIFLLAWWLWRNPLAGVVAALFYALTYSFIGGVVLASYVRQDFTLPFLYFATALLLIAVDTGRRPVAVAAAILFVFSFASWHMAQFYYLVLLAGLIAVYMVVPDARARVVATVAVTLTMLPFSLFFQSLRASWFAVSPPMLASFALIAQHSIVRDPRAPLWKRLAVFLAVGALLAAAAFWVSQGHYGRYSHVYALLIDKLRFLDVKPDNPALLGFESRVMWTSSFMGPSLNAMAGWLGTAWLAGIAGVVIAVRRLRAQPAVAPSIATTLWMAAAFTVLFALIWRMEVFAAFFVCVFAGAAFPRDARSREGTAAIMILMALVAANYWRVTRYAMASDSVPPSITRPVLEFLRDKTGPDDVVLALFQFSPVICAYADRPVIVHSKFENRRVREKVEEFYTSLFKKERDVYEFCRRYGARYFVYEPSMLLDVSGGSIRYMADRLWIAPDCAVMQFQFAPQALAHFQLVFQTDYYRVYRVLDEGEKPAPPAFPAVFPYDIRDFRREQLQVR